MDIKLEQYEPNSDATKQNIVGWARVSLHEKMYVWMTIMRGTKGMWAKFPSIKLNGEFQPALAWPGQDIERKIRDAIMPQIEKKIRTDCP